MEAKGNRFYFDRTIEADNHAVRAINIGLHLQNRLGRLSKEQAKLLEAYDEALYILGPGDEPKVMTLSLQGVILARVALETSLQYPSGVGSTGLWSSDHTDGPNDRMINLQHIEQGVLALKIFEGAHQQTESIQALPVS